MKKESKNYIKTPLVIYTLLISILLNAEFKIKDNSIRAPQQLGKISLYKDKNKFYILQNNNSHEVKSYWVDRLLRNASAQQLSVFLEQGYIAVNQLDNNDFSLKAKVRGLGGGPITGVMAYWATKAFCYGTAVAAASTIVVSGGAMGAVTGAIASASTLGASSGAALIGGAIVGGGMGADAAIVTTSVISSAGGIPAAVAAVEFVSIAAANFFAMIPFLP
ncbi:MAG TPA: hypothetical protein VHA52_04020 [Candidatus Babeliaceae bacterium]|nr:hypothetical protein [Candidatus Babeliaceae bacterium]